MGFCMHDHISWFFIQANLTVYEPNAVMDMLKYVRQWTDQYKPPWIIWALCTSGLLATLVIKMLFPNTTRSTNSSTARYIHTYVCGCCESIVYDTLPLK